MDNHPFVSVVIPVRNEAKYIEKCLDSVFANDYPPDRFDVIVSNPPYVRAEEFDGLDPTVRLFEPRASVPP